MKQISIISRINRKKIFTFFALVLVALTLVSMLIYKNPATTRAFNFDASSLTVATDDVLYIGAGGLQSERVWGDTALYTDTNSLSRADTNIDDDYTLPIRPTPPTNSEYGPGDMADMVYPETGGCPLININTNTLNEYRGGQPIAGACKSIITDGGGAIIRVSGDITINGKVFLGDRVVLIANRIILGPNAMIIGSGQKGGSSAGHDNSAFGGIGAHNGGSAPNLYIYGEGKTCGAPNFSHNVHCPSFSYPTGGWNWYAFNDFNYYYRLS